MKGRVLAVAGSDSSGGAGIQADIKTITALRGYAATAITALTAQDTVTVHEVLPMAPEFVALQMRAVLNDIGADAVKVGMLHNAGIIDAVADTLVAHGAGLPLVYDPAMTAKSGVRLLDDSAVTTLTRRMVPLTTLLTPNMPEAAVLCGEEAVETLEEQRAAAAMLRTLGVAAVLVKGEHGLGAEVHDVLATANGIEVMTSPRISSRSTHGTGSTLAAAIATGLAQGMELRAAVAMGRAYVRRAIAAAPGYGKGRGPLDHTVTVAPFAGD